MAYTYKEDDRLLRYINGEWVNVSAKCNRRKNLGYYDDDDDDANSTTDGSYNQLNKYSYDMEVNDDIDDDDDYMQRHHCNRRPDLFWMGDGYCSQMSPRHRPETVSKGRYRIHQHGDDRNYGDDQKIVQRNRLPHNCFSTYSSVTLIGKAAHNGGKPRSVRFLPQTPPLLPRKHSMCRGYHPYNRPIPMQLSTSPHVEKRDGQPTNVTVPKCCCCERPPVVPMVNRKIEVVPVQIQWQGKEQKQEAEPEPEPEPEIEPKPKPEQSQSSRSTTITDKNVPKIEKIDHSDKPKLIKIEEDKQTTN